MPLHGYAGAVLRVDLGTGKIEKELLDPDWARGFIGGAGMNCRLFHELHRPGISPFDPENPIVIGAGPLVGTPLPGTGKVEGTTKFSLPALEDGRCYVATASSGSRRFGVMLKQAGYDHVVITGRAPRPVVLQILDGEVALLDAERLWGRMDAYETAEELQRRVSGAGVVTIGAAGENRVKFALALTDKMSTLGRNGFGAVMGSKNLKAICVRGTGRISLADFYSAVTGIEVTPAELKTAGERSFNLLRALNVREGFSRKDDAPPPDLVPPQGDPGRREGVHGLLREEADR